MEGCCRERERGREREREGERERERGRERGGGGGGGGGEEKRLVRTTETTLYIHQVQELQEICR